MAKYTLKSELEINNNVTVNNENKYILPTSAGTSGQILKSGGPNNKMYWGEDITSDNYIATFEKLIYSSTYSTLPVTTNIIFSVNTTAYTTFRLLMIVGSGNASEDIRLRIMNASSSEYFSNDYQYFTYSISDIPVSTFNGSLLLNQNKINLTQAVGSANSFNTIEFVFDRIKISPTSDSGYILYTGKFFSLGRKKVSFFEGKIRDSATKTDLQLNLKGFQIVRSGAINAPKSIIRIFGRAS